MEKSVRTLPNRKTNLLFDVIFVIFSHLSKNSRYFKDQEIDLFTETHHQPLFNYINCWKYLNLYHFKRAIQVITSVKNVDKPKIAIVSLIEFTHSYLDLD